MSSTEEENSVVDWTNLPKEILDVILYKLIELSDYIRFKVVCKAWLSVADDQKLQRNTKILKEPPMLLITIPDKANPDFHTFNIKDGLFNFKLYSFSDDKVYSHKFQFPHNIRHLGSSHGWLAIEEPDLSVTLINPFTGKNIHLPMIDSWPDGSIEKVILSCDPATSPDDCVIAVICIVYSKVAFIRPGEKSWTSALPSVNDIIFHKRMLYALKEPQQLIAIDCSVSSHSCNHNDQLPPTFEIVPAEGEYNTCGRIPLLSYLVESLNGSLLLVQKFRLLIENPLPDLKSPVEFKVHKLVKRIIPSSNEVELNWVEIQRLEKDETILLGHTQSMCISASGFRNWHSNSIYFLHNFEDYLYVYYHRKSDDDRIGVFHLDNRRVKKFHKLNDWEPIAWISPTLR